MRRMNDKQSTIDRIEGKLLEVVVMIEHVHRSLRISRHPE